MLLELHQGGQHYAYLYDGKGNVDGLIDDAEAMVAGYVYSPFGRLLTKTGTLDQPFRFSTKAFDEQTGLAYYGYRFYWPSVGRWINRDPIGEAGGINLYGFVGNDPVNWIDPNGENPLLILGAAAFLVLTNPDVANAPGPEDQIEISNGDAGIVIDAALGLGMGIAGSKIAKCYKSQPLYRAVGPDELADLQKTNMFRNPKGIEVKYFSTTRKGAEQYGQMAQKRFNHAPYTVLKTSIPKSQITSQMRTTVDSGIGTIVVPTSKLGLLPPP
ncbi:MAG: RHS repeat-associated core domain-containing protein [Candidatus Electrothrix sp. AX1]|nr:RHS repeat-associated core domain-containing protein [Candidatus Electrothrix sp. AX1]